MRPEYHERDVFQQAPRLAPAGWSTTLERLASNAPPLSTFTAIVAFLALATALGLLLSRARRTAQVAKTRSADLTDEEKAITARELSNT